jgi:hypothetical protein
LRVRSRFPTRPLAIALIATLLVWGAALGSETTWSPEGQVVTINPACRVSGPQLACQMPRSYGGLEDPGAPAWQNIPADYFFRHARLRGEPRPHWNFYIGSGYPIALDGHTSAFSPTQWFLTHFPGDQGHDVVIFVRFALWTFAITWLAALFGASTPLLACVALAASLAPYAAVYVDIAFLDADLLSPLFLLILVATASDRLPLMAAAALSFALGILVGVAPFQQAGFALCFAMGVVALASAPFTRGRSLLLAVCLGIGMLAVVPSWLPLARNLDQFISSRAVQCIAQERIGSTLFLDRLLRPPLIPDRFVFVTLAGVGLMPFLPKRAWFLVIALLVLGAWEVLGLPRATCALPVVSGIRFVRHLLPHLQMLFLAAASIAIATLSRQLHCKRAWAVWIAAEGVVLYAMMQVGPTLAAHWAWRSFCLATTLGVLAGVFHFLPRAGTSPWMRQGARPSFEVALALLAFTPFVFASGAPLRVLEGGGGARQLPRLPDTIDASTPLGTVQTISEQQDRRHYSPSEFLSPNWSQVFRIPDLLLLYALYPTGYHELNAGLFAHWRRDPIHSLNPDRFIHVSWGDVMTPSFQRVLAVHRVSLLTFGRGQAKFARAPSPYAKKSCRLLASSDVQGTESYLCPEVGGIGYFPGTLSIASTRDEALQHLRSLTPSQLLDTAVLGPELDPALASQESLSGAGRVLSVRRWGDDLTYELDVERAGTFVIADTFFRGWRATVNGRRTPISRANVNFKAVRVPAGKVTLKLHFRLVMF